MVVVNSDPPPEDPKPKRPISAAKYVACVANSKRSTGPRTDSGKAAASRNATRSGFTCTAITFLPGEDEDEFHEIVARWARQLRAETEAEYAEVEEAVYARWKQRRIRESQGGAAHRRLENLEAEADDRVADEVRTLIPQIPLAPGAVVQRIRGTSHGCAFLLGQFRLLKARLLTHHAFEISQRRWFLNLLGRRPADLFIDPVVFDLDRLYLGAISGPGSFTAAGAANALLLDRPDDMSDGEFARRLEPMVVNLPTIAEGHAALVRLVDQTIAELAERVELLGLREERQRYLDAKVAKTDTTHDGELRARYDGMAGRERHASLRELRALQADRRKYGAGEGAAPDDPDPPPQNDPRPVTEPAQNEATVPEVDDAVEEAEGPIDVTGPLGGEIPNPNPGAPGPNKSQIPDPRSQTAEVQPPILDSPEEIEAIAAAYRAQVAQVVARVEQALGLAGEGPGPPEQ